MRFNHLFYITALMSLFLFTVAIAKDLPAIVVYPTFCAGKSDGFYSYSDEYGSGKMECVGGKIKRKGAKDLPSTTPTAPTANNNNSGNSTGGTTATGNNAGSGNSSNTTQTPPAFVCAPNMPPEKCNGNGNGSGSDVNSNSSGSSSTNIPTPNVPKASTDLTPDQIKRINNMLAGLAEFYQKELERLQAEKVKEKANYVYLVSYCYSNYTSYPQSYVDKCIDGYKKKFDDKIKQIDEQMLEAVKRFNKAVEDTYAAYGVSITNNVTKLITPSISGNTGTNADNANTNDGAGTTNNTTTNNTTNNSTSNNSSNTTVNNNTTVVNNGGSGSGSGGSSGNGSGANSNSSGKGKGEGKGEEGEGFFDGFCKRNPDTFFCAKADRAAINKAAEGSDDEKVETGLKQTDDQLAQGVADKIKEFRDSKKVDALKRYVYKQFVGHETAACPAPLSFTTFGNHVVFSWQFLCDFLLLIRKFVIGIFALLTMFFVVGNLR